MPLLLGCLALGAPRLVMVLVWLFSDYLSRAYGTWIWPLIGFFVAPLATLAYAWAVNNGPDRAVSGFEFVVVGIAVLIDLGLLGSGARARKRRDD